jgi:hypothetical protein
MEITRSQPFPLTFSQDGFNPNTEYIVTFLDDHNAAFFEEAPTTDSQGTISFELPDYFSKYDDEYRVEIYLVDGVDINEYPIRGELVWVDTLTIMRPYIDPNLLAETIEDIDEAKMYEAVARAIINSITGGFMYKRDTVETVGLGNDYLSIPFRLCRVVKVYENNILVYDLEPTDPNWTNTREYFITPDRGAITVNVGTGTFNRLQSQPVQRQKPASDSFTLYNTNDSPNYIDTPYDTKNFSQSTGGSPMFPNGWDYVVIVETGWPIIPQDIKQATTLIVNDLKCNNIPYINSYIKNYKSDQFTLAFDDRVFRDTGNRIADKILSSYVRPIYRLGVL